MADATFNNPMIYGAFAPTTNVWDVNQIYSTDVQSPEFKELIVRLYQNLNLMSLLLNIKDSGYYNTQEFVNGQLLFPNPALSSSSSTTPTFRQIFRQVINFGALPNAGAKSVNHNITITAATTFTRIYAAASDTTGLTYIPIPYSAVVLNQNIQLDVTATQVTITTGINRTNYNFTYVIIEYVQS